MDEKRRELRTEAYRVLCPHPKSWPCFALPSFETPGKHWRHVVCFLKLSIESRDGKYNAAASAGCCYGHSWKSHFDDPLMLPNNVVSFMKKVWGQISYDSSTSVAITQTRAHKSAKLGSQHGILNQHCVAAIRIRVRLSFSMPCSLFFSLHCYAQHKNRIDTTMGAIKVICILTCWHEGSRLAVWDIRTALKGSSFQRYCLFY